MIDLALIAAVAAAAAPAPLTAADAHHGAVVAGQRTIAAFTESAPVIRADCHRRGDHRATCRVRASGDRASIAFTARIVRDATGLTIYADHLRTTA